MRPIPKRYRDQANENPFYHKCCCGCGLGPAEWHHPLIVARKQIAEIFLPVYHDCHDTPNKKLKFEWIAINVYYKYLLINYPKRDWTQRKKYLDGIFGACPYKTKTHCIELKK
jgi:hypothetical protein